MAPKAAAKRAAAPAAGKKTCAAQPPTFVEPVDIAANAIRFKTMIHFALYDILSADLTCGQACMALSRAPIIVMRLNEKYGGLLHDLEWRSAFLKQSNGALLELSPSQRVMLKDGNEQEKIEELMGCKKEINLKLEEVIHTIDGTTLSEMRFLAARVDILLGNYSEGDVMLWSSLRILGPAYAVPTDKDYDYARRVLSKFVDA